MVISEKTAKEMNEMRENGMTSTEIAAHFGIKSIRIVRYHTKKKYREDTRKRAEAWGKKNPKRKKETEKEWRKNNQEKVRASICMSMMRRCLREGSLTKETVNKEMDNYLEKKQ